MVSLVHCISFPEMKQTTKRRDGKFRTQPCAKMLFFIGRSNTTMDSVIMVKNNFAQQSPSVTNRFLLVFRLFPKKLEGSQKIPQGSLQTLELS